MKSGKFSVKRTSMFVDERESLHPTPLLARKLWTSLDGPWSFAFDDADQGIDDAWNQREDIFDRTITVPFPPESPASGICDRSMHPVIWYRRTFDEPRPQDGRRLIVHFGAVDHDAEVWVNGVHVATHRGGQTPFQADITAALHPGPEQVMVVRAVDMPEDLSQPRGKQDWRETPHEIWYNRTTGIWQPVWLEVVSPAHVTAVEWTPDLDRAMLGMRIELAGLKTSQHRVRVRVNLHDQLLAEDVMTVLGSEVRRSIALEGCSMVVDRDRTLWAPEHPNLLDIEVAVLEGDQVVDEVFSYCGLRSVSIAESRFVLNGNPYYLRMALEQGFWPESHLAAPSNEALRREVELARHMGFNALRIHQKVEDPRFLYWCDRLGMMVWGEMANAFVFSRSSVERLTREWVEVVRRDASHPCIVAWVPMNESWGVPDLLQDPAQQHFVRSLYHLTKSLDPSRPVLANDGWEYTEGDILGIHDYAFDGQIIRQRYGTTDQMERTIREVQPGHRRLSLRNRLEPGLPVMLTEFGGISLRPQDGAPWHGYGTVSDLQSFLSKYRELVDAVLDCEPLSGFCYTQLTDTEQETNGLLTELREPKIDVDAIHEINTRRSSAPFGDAAILVRHPGTAPPAAASSEGENSHN